MKLYKLYAIAFLPLISFAMKESPVTKEELRRLIQEGKYAPVHDAIQNRKGNLLIDKEIFDLSQNCLKDKELMTDPGLIALLIDTMFYFSPIPEQNSSEKKANL